MSEQQTSANGGLTWLANIALGISGLALVAMVLVEGWQVVARYVLNDSPSWTEPVVLLLINIAMMFSASVGVRNGAHFGFKVLVERAAPPLRLVMKQIAHAITALIGAVLAWYGTVMVLDTWSVKLAGAQLPQGVLYLPLSFGGALIVLFACERMLVEITTSNSAAVG
jgi:TRAP-type C4-dicarboxylate transport system permease small subunit